jgi:hypothetical protein
MQVQVNLMLQIMNVIIKCQHNEIEWKYSNRWTDWDVEIHTCSKW